MAYFTTRKNEAQEEESANAWQSYNQEPRDIFVSLAVSPYGAWHGRGLRACLLNE